MFSIRFFFRLRSIPFARVHDYFIISSAFDRLKQRRTKRDTRYRFDTSRFYSQIFCAIFVRKTYWGRCVESIITEESERETGERERKVELYEHLTKTSQQSERE